MGNGLGRPVTAKEVDKAENAQLFFGAASMQGYRSTQEDSHVLCAEVPGRPDLALMGVFDGHGGDEVSGLAAEAAVSIVADQPAVQSGSSDAAELGHALYTAFLELDDHIRVQLTQLFSPELEDDLLHAPSSLSSRRESRDFAASSLVPALPLNAQAALNAAGTASEITPRSIRSASARSRRGSGHGSLPTSPGGKLTLDMGLIGAAGDTPRTDEDALHSTQAMPGSPHEDMEHRVGATAVMVLITPTHVICANAGDSRAILVRAQADNPAAPAVVALSADHKPSDDAESERIVAAGGAVLIGRVNGELGVARALGDFRYKDESKPPSQHIVTAMPDITIEPLDGSELAVVLACDGVWDVFSSEEVAQHAARRLVQGRRDIAALASSIIDAALTEGSKDNISCAAAGFRALMRTVRRNARAAAGHSASGKSEDGSDSESSGASSYAHTPAPEYGDGDDDADGWNIRDEDGEGISALLAQARQSSTDAEQDMDAGMPGVLFSPSPDQAAYGHTWVDDDLDNADARDATLSVSGESRGSGDQDELEASFNQTHRFQGKELKDLLHTMRPKQQQQPAQALHIRQPSTQQQQQQQQQQQRDRAASSSSGLTPALSELVSPPGPSPFSRTQHMQFGKSTKRAAAAAHSQPSQRKPPKPRSVATRPRQGSESSQPGARKPPRSPLQTPAVSAAGDAADWDASASLPAPATRSSDKLHRLELGALLGASTPVEVSPLQAAQLVAGSRGRSDEAPRPALQTPDRRRAEASHRLPGELGSAVTATYSPAANTKQHNRAPPLQKHRAASARSSNGRQGAAMTVASASFMSPQPTGPGRAKPAAAAAAAAEREPTALAPAITPKLRTGAHGRSLPSLPSVQAGQLRTSAWISPVSSYMAGAPSVQREAAGFGGFAPGAARASHKSLVPRPARSTAQASPGHSASGGSSATTPSPPLQVRPTGAPGARMQVGGRAIVKPGSHARLTAYQPSSGLPVWKSK